MWQEVFSVVTSIVIVSVISEVQLDTASVISESGKWTLADITGESFE